MGLIEEFVNRKTSSYNSRKSYTSTLKKFFKSIDVKDVDSYFEQDRNYVNDLIKFSSTITKNSPKSQVVFLSAIKNFLERNDVEIKKSVWDDIKVKNKIRRARPITQKRTPNNADLRKILNYGDVKSRALFVMAATTGMRINELLNITFQDVDFENRHIRIRREIAKSSVPRDVFFTVEAKDILMNWLSVRDDFVVTKYKKSVYCRRKLIRDGYQVKKGEDETWKIFKNKKQLTDEDILNLDNTIFPMNYSDILIMWHNLLEKVGSPYNAKDGRYYLYNVHSLRRFWFSQLESSGANMAHINYIGGHESELNATYTHFELSVLKKTYDEHMDAISIFTELEKLSKQLKPKFEMQDTAIASLVRDNQRLKDELEEIKKFAFYSIGSPPVTENQKALYQILKKIRPELPDDECLSE